MTRIIRGALAICASVAVMAAGVTTAHAEEAPPLPEVPGETVVQLEASDSGACLGIPSKEIKNGARAGLGLCNADTKNTQWRVVPADGFSFEVRSVPSSRCLEVENSGTQVGAAVQIWDCTGGKQMRWQLVLVDHARKLFQLRPMHREDRCLDVINGELSPGAKAQQWYCNQTNAQLWKIKPVNGSEL
ncbi:RICIN domain-containing protein [Streptomyces albireticuli]|uniref:RICIN domain-containing protein n=1 Tax=Streptomyces albireticuli TaxID=1940 RepID=UPI0036BF2A24